MIEVVTLGAETARVSAQLAGDDVVVVAFVCPSRESAGRLLGQIDRRLVDAGARLKARTAVAAPSVAISADEPFPDGAPVRYSTHLWDRGEMAIPSTVIRRISADRLLIRTRMGQRLDVDQRDLERGRRAG